MQEHLSECTLLTAYTRMHACDPRIAKHVYVCFLYVSHAFMYTRCHADVSNCACKNTLEVFSYCTCISQSVL